MSRDPQSPAAETESWARLVESRLQQLRYGVITLTVHDGRVVQVDCTERTRFSGSREAAGTPESPRNHSH
jgi:hypothetical protein